MNTTWTTEKVLAIYNKPLGNLSKPTPIIDLETKEVIRD